MLKLRRILVAVLVASLGVLSATVLAACDEDDEGERVELSLTDRDLSPGRVEVESGEIEFVVKNDGRRVHVFAVETPDGIERTKNIKPGETATLTVDLPVGRYRMYDPRGVYRTRGVRGTVIATSDATADTVTERTVTERTVEEETEEPPPPDEEPPVTVTDRQVQPAPRSPTPTPAPPPPTVTETVPAEPPPSTP